MKEYKIVPVRLIADPGTPTEQKQADHSVSGSIKEFFFPSGAGSDGMFATDKAEALMRQMNEDGWEVISINPTPRYPQMGEILITFERYA